MIPRSSKSWLLSGSGDFQAIRGAMQEIGEGFKADLKAVLTGEQISQLDKLQQERMQRMGRQGGGRRGGGGGRR